jgi:tetratricopeptide (TPR) repeat protein
MDLASARGAGFGHRAKGPTRGSARPRCFAWALRSSLVFLFLLGTIQTGELLWIEGQILKRTPASLERAAELGDERAWLALAHVAPGREVEFLQQALRLNPRDSAAWIELGLAYERAGTLPRASTAFAEADKVDRQYVPAWAHANYAFRQSDRQQFWKSAEWALLVMRSEDVRSLFDLADRLDRNSGEMTWLVKRIGNNRPLARSYLDHLIGKQRWPDALALGLWMETRTSKGPADSQEFDFQPNDIVRLAHLTTRLIRAGQIASAVQIWNGLPGIERIPPQGIRLLNGRFASSPTGQGFNWRLFSASGISGTWLSGRLEFQVNGKQSDEAVLLDQPIVAFDPAAIALHWRYSFHPQNQRLEEIGSTRERPFPRDVQREKRPEDSSASNQDNCAFDFVWELEGSLGRRPLTISDVALDDRSGDQQAVARTCVATGKLLLPPSRRAQDRRPAMWRLRLVLRRADGQRPLRGTLVLNEVALEPRPAILRVRE